MIHSVFPTQIYHHSLGAKFTALRKTLENEAWAFSELDLAGIKWCKKNHYYGYTSYGSLSQLHQQSPTFLELDQALRPHLQNYAKTLRFKGARSLFALDSMWVNIMPRYAYHTMHLHPLSVISGTYYVQVPKKASPLRFEDPKMASYMARPPILLSAKSQNPSPSPYHFEIFPKNNDLILFESWVRHEVPINHSTKERITISFNYRMES